MHVPAALLPFDTLRRTIDWKRWGALAAEAPPFLSPEFFTLIRPLARGGTPLLAEAWTSARMLGALPLVLDGTTLRAMRSDHSPAFDYCGDPAGIDAIWTCLHEDPRWSELVLDKVPAESPIATHLVGLARRDGHQVVVRPEGRHPYFALPKFESAMSAKFRANLARCERKAGGVLLERIMVPTRADFADAYAIEAAAWKGANGTAIAADPNAAHLYAALGRLYGRRGRAALYFLRAAGKRIATLFAVEDARTLFALKIGFDPAAANLSPGHLMILHVARDAEQRGLQELDFVGREDEWKRKWTDLAREQVTVQIYARNPRGLGRYWLREVIKPLLPEQLRTSPRSPLPRTCQRTNIIGAHTQLERVRGRLDRGLGIKSGLERLFAKRKPARDPLGEASEFPVGSWVRVRARDELAAALDDRQRTRGLAFVPVQWEECGKVFRVQRHVRRLRDDRGQFRAVSRTVLLEGSDCNGHGAAPAGCGRHCPLMYRDEWLEAASAPSALPRPVQVQHARVRDAADIAAGLDLSGRRDGLTFMPEMAQYAGKRFAIAGTLDRVFEHDRWVAPPHPVFVLTGVHCSGAITGERGPCDRACALLWHADWLIVEPDAR